MYGTIAHLNKYRVTVLKSSKFDEIVDETLMQIEDAIENLDMDIDFDTISGILTLEFEDHSKIIINRQLATSQLWVAAKSGGFHFDYIDNQWLDDRDTTNLQQRLSELVSEQSGSKHSIELDY